MGTVEREETCTACWQGLAEMEPHVRTFARRRCRDVHELDDVVQETLLRAARYRRGLTDETRLKAWTLRIAANVVRDRNRRERAVWSQHAEEGELAALEGHEADPGSAGEWMRLTEFGVVMEHDALAGHVARVICELPPGDARVLRSYYCDPISSARAAAACGVANELVKTRLYRARRRLRRRLSLVLDLLPWVERCAPSLVQKEL